MNERIRELAEQAGHKPLGTFADELMDIYNKKFAKLIVRECAGLVPAEQSHAPDGRPLLKIFEEHFGVADVDL